MKCNLFSEMTPAFHKIGPFVLLYVVWYHFLRIFAHLLWKSSTILNILLSLVPLFTLFSSIIPKKVGPYFIFSHSGTTNRIFHRNAGEGDFLFQDKFAFSKWADATCQVFIKKLDTILTDYKNNGPL